MQFACRFFDADTPQPCRNLAKFLHDRQQFLNLISKSKVVHLSSHGMVNAADPNLSFIAFSQLGDSLEAEEMLYFNDLYALPLNTE